MKEVSNRQSGGGGPPAGSVWQLWKLGRARLTCRAPQWSNNTPPHTLLARANYLASPAARPRARLLIGNPRCEGRHVQVQAGRNARMGGEKRMEWWAGLAHAACMGMGAHMGVQECGVVCSRTRNNNNTHKYGWGQGRSGQGRARPGRAGQVGLPMRKVVVWVQEKQKKIGKKQRVESKGSRLICCPTRVKVRGREGGREGGRKGKKSKQGRRAKKKSRSRLGRKGSKKKSGTDFCGPSVRLVGSEVLCSAFCVRQLLWIRNCHCEGRAGPGPTLTPLSIILSHTVPPIYPTMPNTEPKKTNESDQANELTTELITSICVCLGPMNPECTAPPMNEYLPSFLFYLRTTYLPTCLSPSLPYHTVHRSPVSASPAVYLPTALTGGVAVAG